MTNEAQLKPYDYKLGGNDNDGAKIEMIYAKHIDFVVYRTERSIRVDYNDDSPKLETYFENHHKISVILGRIYSWLPENLSWSESINSQIARAMTTNISGNFDDAIQMLKHAEQRIIDLKTIQGRLQYTFSAFFLVLLTFTALYFTPKSEHEIFSYIAFYGSLGGALSVAIGFSKLEIDIDANWIINSLIGGSRILIAIAAATFSYLAIQSGVAFSFVTNLTTNNGVFMIAMISGFIEMLIPNLMNNLTSEDK